MRNPFRKIGAFDLFAIADRDLAEARASIPKGYLDEVRVDPATLRRGHYDPYDSVQVCFCGHARQLHSLKGHYWDGTCLQEHCLCESTGFGPGVPINQEST